MASAYDITQKRGSMTSTVVESQNLGLGQSGCILIDDNAEHLGPFVAISALEDAAIDISECDMAWVDDIADFTLPKGMTIYGTFTSIELDSGKVIAYYGPGKQS